MIRNSFLFVPGIGQRKERNLWSRGIMNWDDFLEAKRIRGLSSSMKAYGDRQVRLAREALYCGDVHYLSSIIPPPEHWRLYKFFRDETLGLDIETDGLGARSRITVIGLHDGLAFKAMIDGINMDYPRLVQELANYKLLLTFNGGSFDLPMIEKNTHLPRLLHIDVMTVCARIGLRGGLKGIERTLGISRPSEVGGLHGGDALSLWRMYRATGDDHYLNLLLEYNEQDCANLFALADHACAELQKRMLPMKVAN